MAWEVIFCNSVRFLWFQTRDVYGVPLYIDEETRDVIIANAEPYISYIKHTELQ